MKIIVITICNHSTGEAWPRIYKATDDNYASIQREREEEVKKECCDEYDEDDFDDLPISIESHIFDLDEIA